MQPDFYKKEFIEKCACKGLKAADFLKKLEERLPQYKGRWNHSLNEQIKNLPDFETTEREVKRHFKKMNLA